MRETGSLRPSHPARVSFPEDDIAGQGPQSRFAETIAAMQLRVQRHDTARAKRRLNDAVVRGAAAGLALRGGLHLVSYAVGLLNNRRRSSGGGRGSDAPSLKELLKDTLRWTAFLGTFSGTFVLADETIACLGGRQSTGAWRALAAGAVAGPTLLLTGPDTQHTSLALYIFIRGATLLVRCGNLPSAAPWKRRLLAPTRFQHGDVVIMCVSAAELLYSWIVLPSALQPSYVRFLNKHGGLDLRLLDAFREMCSRADAARRGLSVPPGPLKMLQGTKHEHFLGSIPCDIIHQGQSCTMHTLAFFPPAYLRALPVYLPVYTIPAALVHRGRLLAPETRKELWTKVVLGALRSSAFLALYCTLAWRGMCTGFQVSGGASGRLVAASVWVAGLAVLVEKKSRRMELALYCLSRALESFALAAVAWGWIPRGGRWIPRRLDVLLFSAAAAAICHCYSDHGGARRDVFRSKYLTVFDFIFGNTGFGEKDGSGIAHVPSNGELFSLASRRLEARARALARSASNLAALVAMPEHRAASPLEAPGLDTSDGSESDNSSEDGRIKGKRAGSEV